MVAFSVREGLPAGTVMRILGDSKGFVWIPHKDGLTRYDGTDFQTFSQDDGLPSKSVSQILERANGTYWIAADRHLCLFDPSPGRARFQCEPPNLGEIEAILEQKDSLWCGTGQGLWRRTGTGAWNAVLPKAAIRRLIEDSRGDVWAATNAGLYRFRKQGKIEQWTTKNGLCVGLCDDYITTVNETPGAIWAGTQTALFRFAIDPDGTARIAGHYGASQGLPSVYVNEIRFWQGAVWAATFQGLARLLPSGRWQPVELDRAVTNLPLNALAVDTQDSLWVGSDGAGAARLAPSGFSNFTETDGLPIRKVWAIQEDRNGTLVAITKDEHQYALNQFDGLRFHPLPLTSPFGTMWGWSWSQIAFQTEAGIWWLGTSTGLLRYEKGLHSPPSRTAAGLPYDGNFVRIFQERSGAVWAATNNRGENGLYRREPGGGKFRRLNEADGLPSSHKKGRPVSALAEDQRGQVWLALLDGGLLRYRNGRFEYFGESFRGVRALLVDQRGRLWIGTTANGLLRVDETAAGIPVFVGFDRASGLLDSQIHALAEDRQGRIYATTQGTVHRLDMSLPRESRIRRFTAADGLLSGEMRVAFGDRHGAMWFGGDQGLCRLLPADDPAMETSILIHTIRVNGKSRALSALGEADPAALTLDSTERHVQVDFGGLRNDLTYQTMLSGVDPDWTPPSRDRRVNYVSLAPGGYQLLIRGIAPSGAVSSKPARVRFEIAAPVWQRWWFLMLFAGALIAGAYSSHRLVLERRLAVERTRSRIATDLHDDIGSSLARISVLSDVLRTRLGTVPEQTPVLDQIATSARDVIEKMNDIVWAIDPRQDALSDVVARIRHFASDVLDAREIRWSFTAPPAAERLNLSLEQRRHLLLIFKEAIHNVVRHSGCRQAELRIELGDASLRAFIKDDGAGIPVGSEPGRGLTSMRQRAAQLRGSLNVTSAPGQGTEISLTFPLQGAY